MKEHHRMEKAVKGCAMAAIIILPILIANIKTVVQSFHPREYTVTVTRLDSKRYGKSDKWLVFAEDEGTGELYEFENTDNVFLWKWDSSSMQNRLREGNAYVIKTRGFRVKWLSWYPNVVEIEER